VNRQGPAANGAPDTDMTSQADTAQSNGIPGHDQPNRCTWSQQVDWWSVHEHVAGRLQAAGSWPTAGSVEWVALPDGDPRKLASLLDAARHWALRVETCQQAECEASRDVSAAADWRAVSASMLRRAAVYIPRKAAS